jgi:hypothetical protein
LNHDFVISGLVLSKHQHRSKKALKRYRFFQTYLDIQEHKVRIPKVLPLRCVFSHSTSRMSGGDVQTDSPSTPSRFLDISNKENFHTKFSESAWRHRWEALDCRKRHASRYRRSADSQARYLRFSHKDPRTDYFSSSVCTHLNSGTLSCSTSAFAAWSALLDEFCSSSKI